MDKPHYISVDMASGPDHSVKFIYRPGLGNSVVCEPVTDLNVIDTITEAKRPGAMPGQKRVEN